MFSFINTFIREYKRLNINEHTDYFSREQNIESLDSILELND